MYTTALVDKLTLVGTANEPLIDPEGDDKLRDEQNGLFENFTNAFYNYPVTNIDCKNPEHSLTFQATEDRPGITDQKKPSTSNNDSNENLISTVSTIGAKYLHSYHGFDYSGDDGGLHNTIRRIQSGEETNMDTVIWAHRALNYRMTQMSTADMYVSMTGIPYQMDFYATNTTSEMLASTLEARKIPFSSGSSSTGRIYFFVRQRLKADRSTRAWVT